MMSDELKTPEMLSLLDDSKDDSVEQLTEQLSVIKEVRGELVKTYTEMNSLKQTNEKLSNDNDNLNNEFNNMNSTIESLTKELNAYKARDAEVETLKYNKRLEQLSANFKGLGQERTIEELSKLNKTVIAEFETITNIALNKKSSERLDAVTVPSQAINSVRKEIVKPAEKDFFKGMCNVLQGQQVSQSKEKSIYL